MENKKNYFFIIIGIVLPIILIFSFQSYIERVFGQYNIWFVGLIYFLFILWSIEEARSQKKFFNKNQDLLLKQIVKAGDFSGFEETDKIKNNLFNLGNLFFIQSAANFFYFLIWWTFIFEPSLFATRNLWNELEIINTFYLAVFVVGFSVFLCNLFRVLMTSKIFGISLGSSLNSIKFILIEEIILYGLFGTYLAFIGGFFL